MKAKYSIAIAMLAIAVLSFIRFHRVHTATAASAAVTGTVKFEGTVPKQRTIDMSKEPSCAQIHASDPATIQTAVVDPNGGLQYAVIYVSEGLNAAQVQPSTEPVTIDQKGCQYQPHVLAVDTMEKVKVTNSDSTSHNIHPMPKNNSEWNKSQPPGSPPFEESFKNEEIAIPVKCNVHPWMKGYIAVVKGPYAVSGKDGTFSLANLPPGNYTLTAWHETFGTQTQKVTVAAGKPATANFVFKK